MKLAIIGTKKDPVSEKTISELIKEAKKTGAGKEPYDYEEYELMGTRIYYFSNKEIIALENIDKKIEADLFLFVSKHQSKNPVKCLTTHSIGNYGEAELGGKNNTLVLSSTNALLKALRLQAKAKNINYEYFQEATHHGPYLEKPALFMEIGSTKTEWEDQQAIKLLTENIKEFIKQKDIEEEHKTGIGIGGLHNALGFRRLAIEKKIVASHILPKYNLRLLTKKTIEEMINKTLEPVTCIILDWKSLGPEKQRIMTFLEEEGYTKKYEIIKRN